MIDNLVEFVCAVQAKLEYHFVSARALDLRGTAGVLRWKGNGERADPLGMNHDSQATSSARNVSLSGYDAGEV